MGGPGGGGAGFFVDRVTDDPKLTLLSDPQQNDNPTAARYANGGEESEQPPPAAQPAGQAPAAQPMTGAQPPAGQPGAQPVFPDIRGPAARWCPRAAPAGAGRARDAG